MDDESFVDAVKCTKELIEMLHANPEVNLNEDVQDEDESVTDKRKSHVL